MAAARSLVVVGGADASATDALADALRDEFAVRTAYSQPDLLASLDGEVDVVLVAPDLPGFDADGLRTRLAPLDCRVGVLTTDATGGATECGDAAGGADVGGDGPSGPAALADLSVATPDDAAEDTAWRGAVSRLAARAYYRKRLEEYYDTADEYAGLTVGASGDDEASGGNDAGVDAAERERLARVLDRIRDDLADAAEALSPESVFDVAMDDWVAEGGDDEDSEDDEAGDDDDEAGDEGDEASGGDDEDSGDDDGAGDEGDEGIESG